MATLASVSTGIFMATPWTPFLTPQAMDQDIYARVLDGSGRVAFRAASILSNGLDLFNILGGPIIIDYLALLCVTVNDTTASTVQFRLTPTVGAAAQTISAASGSLASAAPGASVTLQGTALATAALLNANGPNLIANPGTIIATVGVLDVVVAIGSTTGTWSTYMRYFPLVPGATVTAM